MPELIETFLIGNPASGGHVAYDMPSTSSFDQLQFNQHYNLEIFSSDFRRFVDAQSEIKPHFNPTFFTWFFLGSLLNLPESGLMSRLGVKDLFVKYKDGSIRVAFGRQEGNKVTLVFRTICMLGKCPAQNDPGTFSHEELHELVFKWDLNHLGLKNIDLDVKYLEFQNIKDPTANHIAFVAFDLLSRTEAPHNTLLLLDSICKARLRDQLANKPFHLQNPEFVGVWEKPVTEIAQVHSLFENLQKTNVLTVQDSIKQLLHRFSGRLKYYSRFLQIFNHRAEDVMGYLSGIFVMNYRDRYKLVCKINWSFLDTNVLLTVLPQRSLNPRLNANVPIILVASDDTLHSASNLQVIKSSGYRETLPSFSTDSKLAVIGSISYNHDMASNTLTPTVDTDAVEINQGLLHKFVKVYNHFLNKLPSAQHFLSLELNNINNHLGSLDSSLMTPYLLGQTLAITDNSVKKFLFSHDNAVHEENIKTFMIFCDDSTLLVFNVANEQGVSAFLGAYRQNLFQLPANLRFENVLQVNLMLDKNRGSYVDLKLINVESLSHPRDAFSIHYGHVREISSIDIPQFADLMKERQIKSVEQILNRCLFDHKSIVKDNEHLKLLFKGLFASKMMTLSSLEKKSASTVVALPRELPFLSKGYSLRELLSAPAHSDNVLHSTSPVIIKFNCINTPEPRLAKNELRKAVMGFSIEYYLGLESPTSEETPTLFSLTFNLGSRDSANLVVSEIWKPHNALRNSKTLFSKLLLSTATDCNTRRRKRNNAMCTFSDMDLSKFTSISENGKDTLATTLKVDSDKFAEFCKNEENQNKIKDILSYLNEQIEDGSSVEGSKKGELTELIMNSKAVTTLNKVSRFANFGTIGLIGKDIVSDLFKGDYKKAAVVSSFILGSIGLGMSSPVLNSLGLKLGLRGYKVGGTFLRASAPFIGKLASGYVIYDLINNVNMLHGENKDIAVAGIMADSTFLVIDVLDIGITLAETFGVIEGVSSIFGPIGAIVGALVFIGTNIYSVTRTVNKIDQMIELTTTEKITEGFRAFFGVSPEQHVQNLIERKDHFNSLAKNAFDFLTNNTQFRSYYFPTQYHDGSNWKDYADNSMDLNFTISRSFLDRDKPVVPLETVLDCFDMTSEAKFDIKLDNENMTLLPKNSKAYQILGSAKNHDEYIGDQYSHLCYNFMGISRKNSKAKHSLIDLKHGNDCIQGHWNSPNIFLLGNGKKKIIGGPKGDFFWLTGNNTEGVMIAQENCNNTLDFSYYGNENFAIDVSLSSPQYIKYNGKTIKMRSMTSLIGRQNLADTVIIGCDTDFINLQGGQSETLHDKVKIGNMMCNYKVSMNVGSWSTVLNVATFGEFSYLLETQAPGRIVVHLAENSKANHHITFQDEIESLTALQTSDENSVVFVFKNNMQVFLSGYESTKCAFYFARGSSKIQYDIDEKGVHFHAYVSAKKGFYPSAIVKHYSEIAHKLSMSFLIQSQHLNSTMFISHPNNHMKFNTSFNVQSSNIVHNDPFHTTYIYGSRSENVYIITNGKSKLKSVSDTIIPTVHIFEDPLNNFTSTLVLESIADQLKKDLNCMMHFEIIMNQPNAIMIEISAFDILDHNFTSIARISLQNSDHGVFKESVTDKMHIIYSDNPLRLVFNKSSQVFKLLPIPVAIDPDVKFMVLNSAVVKRNTEFEIPQYVNDFNFLRGNDNTSLVLFEKPSNGTDSLHKFEHHSFSVQNKKEDLFYLVLQDFFTEASTLPTLKFAFKNKQIDFEHDYNNILTAQSMVELANQYERTYSNMIERFVSNISK